MSIITLVQREDPLYRVWVDERPTDFLVERCRSFYEFLWEKDEDLYSLRFPHHGIRSDDPLATEEIITLVREILLTGEVEICVRGLFEYAEIV